VTLYLYAVRCNFTGSPERERLWHEWYDGPKRRQMLQLPQFLTMQRFRAAHLDARRKYLALWLVRSPGAFETPEYRAQWGFADWTGEIGDWSRDLYRADDAIDEMIEIKKNEALYVVSADGMSDCDARAAVAAVRAARPGVAWLESAGLDQHAPMLGLARLGAGAAMKPLADAHGLCETVFTPLGDRVRAPGA
jgi:hypothetical protein